MKFNPIVKRDIAVGSRSYRLMALITAVNAVLFAVVLITLFGRLTGMRLDRSFDQRSTLQIYAMTVLVMFLLVLFVFPAFTAGSITSERDSGTLDLMLASALSPARIVFGKLISRLLVALALLASFLPAMIMPLVFGGVDLQASLGLLLLFVPIAALLLCIGLFSSSVTSSVTGSVLVTYGIVFGMVLLPYLLAFFARTLQLGGRAAAAFLYFSPLTQIAAAVLRQIGETSLLEQGLAFFGIQDPAAFIPMLKPRCILWQSIAALLFFIFSVTSIVPGWNLQIRRKCGKKPTEKEQQ